MNKKKNNMRLALTMAAACTVIGMGGCSKEQKPQDHRPAANGTAMVNRATSPESLLRGDTNSARMFNSLQSLADSLSGRGSRENIVAATNIAVIVDGCLIAGEIYDSLGEPVTSKRMRQRLASDLSEEGYYKESADVYLNMGDAENAKLQRIYDSGTRTSVTVAWDPSQGPALEGYIAMIGSQSGKYNIERAYLGPDSTAYTFHNLRTGREYFYDVASYNSWFSDGSPAPEQHFETKLARIITPPFNLGGEPTTIRFQMKPGHTYDVQTAYWAEGPWKTIFTDTKKGSRIAWGCYVDNEPTKGGLRHAEQSHRFYKIVDRTEPEQDLPKSEPTNPTNMSKPEAPKNPARQLEDTAPRRNQTSTRA